MESLHGLLLRKKIWERRSGFRDINEAQRILSVLSAIVTNFRPTQWA
jgi:hypothetical protein